MTLMVFDSGLGGLSILREVRAVLPDLPIVYVADDAAFPYGDWREDELVPRILDVVAAAIDRHAPQLVIVACNTASTLVMEPLRERFDIPFVGTVPAIKPAAEQTASGLISVLATPGTVKREYTHDLIDKFAASAEVRLVGSDALAAVAEDHLTGGTVDMDLVRDEIAPCFVERAGAKTDIVVLACTHYPFLINVFRKVAPWPVDWLDPAEAIARRALELAGGGAPAAGEPHQPDRAEFTSGTPSPAAARLVAGFGLVA